MSLRKSEGITDPRLSYQDYRQDIIFAATRLKLQNVNMKLHMNDVPLLAVKLHKAYIL